jgi:hypothetical protein
LNRCKEVTIGWNHVDCSPAFHEISIFGKSGTIKSKKWPGLQNTKKTGTITKMTTVLVVPHSNWFNRIFRIQKCPSGLTLNPKPLSAKLKPSG